jgi:hypothetical protein
LRTVANTRQPFRAKRKAVARPMPLEAPVIRILFVASAIVGLLLVQLRIRGDSARTLCVIAAFHVAQSQDSTSVMIFSSVGH